MGFEMSFQPKSLQAAQLPALQQSSAFRAALASMGVPHGVVETQNGPVTVVCRGPLGLISRADLRNSDTSRAAKALGCPWLIVNAETTAGGRGLPLMTPASIAEIDLSPSLGNLRQALAPKWRNKLNQSQTHKIKVKTSHLAPDTSHWLLKLEHNQRRTKGYRGLPTVFASAFAHANPGQAMLFEATVKRDTIAAMLWLRHDVGATYHIGWSGEVGRAHSAHHRLMWHAIEHFKGQGVQHLDLGGVATDHSEGLARFKLGTGAHLRKLGGTWGLWPAAYLR